MQPLRDVVDMLAERCSTLTLLASLLSGEPNPEVMEPLLRELVTQPPDGEAEGRGERLLRDFALATQARPVAEVTAELATEYVAMFFASWRRVLAPYESVYAGKHRILLQEPSRQLRALYVAEGLEPATGGEPADHVAFELSYHGYLCQRSLDAAQAGDARTTQLWLDKQQDFLDQHLLSWVPAFCDDLEAMTTSDFYRGLAALTKEFLESEPALIAEMSALLREAGR